MSERSASKQIVEAAVASGDQRRRWRDALRGVSRSLPWAAAGVLAVAVVGRLVPWPLATVGVAAAVAVITLAARGVYVGRRVPLSDAAATRLDDDARLSGELRSAHWFATDARGTSVWIDAHLDAAAGHAAVVPWTDVYPRAGHPRAWVSATAMAALTIAVMVWVPTRVQTAKSASSVRNAAKTAASTRPDLAKALAALASGELTPEEARDLAELLLKDPNLDPKLEAQLKALTGETPKSGDKSESSQAGGLGSPGESPDAMSQEDAEWAVAETASKLANEQTRQNKEPMPADPNAESVDQAGNSTVTGLGQQKKLGEARESAEGEPGGAGDPEDAADAGGDSQENSGLTAGGAGKSPEVQALRAQVKDLSDALKKETINPDNSPEGKSIQTEERHQTARGRSTLTFTHSTPLPGYTGLRVTPMLPIPEARRILLEQYFVRPPQ